MGAGKIVKGMPEFQVFDVNGQLSLSSGIEIGHDNFKHLYVVVCI